MEEEELVAVFTGSPRDAEMLRAALAGSGIEAAIQSSGIGGAYPVNVGDLAKTKLLVRPEDAEDARAVIAAGDDGMLDEGPPEPTTAARVLFGRVLVWLALITVVAIIGGWLAGELRNLIP